jgi:RNA polymerase sigma factor (sigma-70 family)
MPPEADPRQFATTRWTLVVAAANDPVSTQGQDALAVLCKTYWFPVYAFIRRFGRSTEDARDLTQSFFARVLEKHYLKAADPQRGRFRSFLLASVRNFLANEHDREAALKRGGGLAPLPLEFGDDDHHYSREPVDTLTPEQVYERNWALAAMADAWMRLETNQTGTARRTMFRQLKPFLSGDDPASYAELARALHMPEGTLRVTVHRLRQQFGQCLRDVVSETVLLHDEVDDEVRHLLQVAGA